MPVHPVRPQDIQAELSSAEQLSFDSFMFMVNQELIRQRYHGPQSFRQSLGDSLTAPVRSAIVQAYSKYWDNVRIIEESKVWVLYLEEPRDAERR